MSLLRTSIIFLPFPYRVARRCFHSIYVREVGRYRVDPAQDHQPIAGRLLELMRVWRDVEH